MDGTENKTVIIKSGEIFFMQKRMCYRSEEEIRRKNFLKKQKILKKKEKPLLIFL
jgi:hypothetical protein